MTKSGCIILITGIALAISAGIYFFTPQTRYRAATGPFAPEGASDITYHQGISSAFVVCTVDTAAFEAWRTKHQLTNREGSGTPTLHMRGIADERCPAETVILIEPDAVEKTRAQFPNGVVTVTTGDWGHSPNLIKGGIFFIYDADRDILYYRWSMN